MSSSSGAPRAIGWLDLLVGGVFLLLGLLALSSAPGAFARLGQEPEDFWGLVFLSIACSAVGAVVILIGWTLVRGSPPRGSPVLVSRLSLLVAVIVALAAAVGFWPDDPASGELRLLVVPAVILVISHLLLRRSRT